MPIDPTDERLHEPQGPDTPIVPAHHEPAENQQLDDADTDDDEADDAEMQEHKPPA